MAQLGGNPYIAPENCETTHLCIAWIGGAAANKELTKNKRRMNASPMAFW
jgi:hypothetical protein